MSVKQIQNQQAIWLKSTSFLYWMLIEGVFDYAVVSGLVNLDQSGQGSSFRATSFGVPLCSCLVAQIDVCILFNFLLKVLKMYCRNVNFL